MRERCKQCPSLIPASRMAKHLELKHNVELKIGMLENASFDDAQQNEDATPVEVQETEQQSNDECEEEEDTTNKENPSDESVALDKSKDDIVDDNSRVDAETHDGDNDEDEIIPMGLAKRKRAIIDDDDDAETELPSKKSNSPVKEEVSDVSTDTDEGASACSYCPAKMATAEELKAHMSKEHAWLDAEIDDNVTYGGSDLGEVDYEDVDIDYDEEGDDFFEDGDLVEMPVAVGNLEEMSVAVDAATNSFHTEDCDFCEETVSRSSMNEHLLKQHDINMMEGDTPAPTKTNPAGDAEVTPCPICKTPIATAILAIHVTYYHAEVVNQEVAKSKEVAKLKEVLNDEEESFGEQCEMCDERMAASKMIAHLLEAHDIKVIDEKLDESSEVDTPASEDPVGEDPFAIPDFLREKPKRPKFKCHHCQKKFSTREKVDIHTNKRHEGRCQVCVTYKLVQENRYIGIMKQLNKTAKGLKEDVLPAGDNIVTGQVEEIVYNYEDLYPDEEYEECEECEDDFYWRNTKEHSCNLSQANMRILSGQKFKWGDPEEADDESEDGEEFFEYITNRLGKSIVDRASKDTSTAYVRYIVYDIVNKALDGKQFNPIKYSDPPVSQYVRQKQLEEDQSLQLKSQILAYRYLKRKETLPNIVERAASYENFRDSPANEKRKLSDYFYKEYKEDIEKEEKENYEKKDEEKKRLQEETLREMTTAKLYDYSKYFIPTIKPPKKQRKMLPKKEQKTPLLDSMMNNSMNNSGFKLPSGSALQMNDRNYLNKLKQHQEKTVKKLNMIQQGSDMNSKQYQETMRELEVDNRRLENLNKAPSFMNPFRPNSIKQEPAIKLEPGSLGKPAIQLGQMPGISIKRVEPQPPKLEIKKESPSPALQRLQSLGLSISVGQNGQSRPLEPLKPKHEPGLNRTYPGQHQQKPEPVLNNSVLEQYRQLAGIKKRPEPENQARPAAQSLWNASARGREPQQPVRNQMQPQKEHLQREQLQHPRTPMPQPREPVRRDPGQLGKNLMNHSREPLQPLGNSNLSQNRRSINSFPNREPARDSFKKPAPRPHAPQRPPQNMPARPLPSPPSRPASSRPVSLAKAEYTDSQKLQLKSQILAYRMVSRKERLPQIVKLAASNTNLKGMNIPKNEMRSLSNFFRQEYSAIA